MKECKRKQTFILHFSRFFVILHPNYKFVNLIEKHIVLEDIDPVIFFGVANAHLQMLRSLFPKLRIMARDNVIRVLGDEEQMAAFEESIEKLRFHVLQFNSLKDAPMLIEAAERLGLRLEKQKEDHDWCCLVFSCA